MGSAVYPECSRGGYTLIELLVVVSIISAVSVFAFIDFKDFSAEQNTSKALRELQTYLRLAQSNATSRTLCGVNNQPKSWEIIINTTPGSNQNIILRCNYEGGSVDKTYALENARISSITGSSDTYCMTTGLKINYLAGAGAVTFSDPPNPCIQVSRSLAINITNVLDQTSKRLTVEKGGAIGEE